MTWDYILEIPFESKGSFYHKTRDKYVYSGTTYFLLDNKGKVLRDFVILNNRFNYRPNDNAMMIGKTGYGTDFWKKNGNDRLKVFPKSAVNFELKWSDEMMKSKLNDLSINKMSTALSMDGMITGSNASGADKRIEASPMICTDNTFYGMRFINAFKNLRVSKNNSKACDRHVITMEQLKKSAKLPLKEYFELFPKSRREFYRYNPESYEILFKENSDDETQNIYFDNFKKSHLESEERTYQDNIIRVIKRYAEQKMEKQNMVSYLRGIQRTLLILENRKINEPVILGRNEDIKNCDAAHIIEVRDILKENDETKLTLIADKSNGLLLPKDIHWKFDKDENFAIDENFNLIYKGQNIGRINEKYINDSRKQYLTIRNSQ